MSRELILVTKRKYEDLLKRVEECNNQNHHGETTRTDENVEKDNECSTIKRPVMKREHEMNNSTNNRKIYSGIQTDEQFGAGIQPFVKMSFDTFDRIHSKKRKTDRRRKWMSFNL